MAARHLGWSRFSERNPLHAGDLGQVYGRMALEYEQRAQHTELQRRCEALLAEHILARLPPGARLIEVGCGPGLLAIELARRGAQVVAADVSEGMLEHVSRRAREAGVELPVQWLDATREPQGLGPFDALLTMNGPLSFEPDGAEVLRRLCRLLRLRGQVWLAMPRAAALEQVVRHPLRALRPLLHWKRPHVAHGLLKGQSIDLCIWDPSAFARAVRPFLEVEEVQASGLVLHGPRALDEWLGSRRGLRRAGAYSILYGRVRAPSAASP